MAPDQQVPYHEDADRLRRDFVWYLTFWSSALEQQRRRVLERPADRTGQSRVRAEVDLYLFVLALRQFLRSAEKLVELDPQHRRALDEFRKAVPDMVLFRDVLTHYDEYEQGGGRHQPRDREPYGKRRGRSGSTPTCGTPAPPPCCGWATRTSSST